MKRTYSLAAGIVLLLGLLAVPRGEAAPAPDPKSPLAQLPADTPLVVHLRGVAGTRDRLLALVKRGLPELLPLIEPKVDEWMKEGVDGRKIRGLPENGPIFLFYSDLSKAKQNPPPIGILLKTTRYEELRDNLLKEEERKNLKDNGKGVERSDIDNEPIYFVDRSGWAIITPNEDVATAFTKKPDTTLDGRLSKTLADRLLTSDLGMYVAMDLINKEYGDQIKQAQEEFGKKMKEAADQGNLKGAGQALPLIQKVMESIFQTVGDSKGLIVTLELRKTGLALHAQTEIRPDTPTAGVLKDSQPQAFEQLGQLPAGRQAYSALDCGPSLARSLRGMLFGIVANSGEKDDKQIQEAIDALIHAGPGRVLEAQGVPIRGLRVSSYDEPGKALEAYRKLLGAVRPGCSFDSGILAKKPTVQEKANKLDDMELDRVDVSWDLEQMAEKASGAKELTDDARKAMIEGLKRLRGERATYWLGSDGKALYQVSARTWNEAQELLKQFKQGGKQIGSDPTFQSILKELPRRNSYVAIVDMVQYLGPMFDIMKPALSAAHVPIPENYPAALKASEVGYLAMAGTAAPRALSFDLFFSTEMINAYYRALVKPFVHDPNN